MADRKHILIIDDDAHFRTVIRDALQFEGFSVEVTRSGALGIESARKHRPDIVLLDVMMPDLDGGEVASAMHADHVLASIPIIFVTAMISPAEAKARRGRFGGEVFFAKPVDMDALLATIRDKLGD